MNERASALHKRHLRVQKSLIYTNRTREIPIFWFERHISFSSLIQYFLRYLNELFKLFDSIRMNAVEKRVLQIMLFVHVIQIFLIQSIYFLFT